MGEAAGVGAERRLGASALCREGTRGLWSRAQHQSLLLPLPYVLAQASGGPWARLSPPTRLFRLKSVERPHVVCWGEEKGREGAGLGGGWVWAQKALGRHAPPASPQVTSPASLGVTLRPAGSPGCCCASLPPFTSSAHPGGGGVGCGGWTKGDQGGTGLVQVMPEQALGHCPV